MTVRTRDHESPIRLLCDEKKCFATDQPRPGKQALGIYLQAVLLFQDPGWALGGGGWSHS